MSFTRPFVTPRFIDFEEADSYRHGLSIALRPIDEFTQDLLRIPLRIKLKERPKVRPLRNLSGFLCFQDLQAGNYTLVIARDPAVTDLFYVKPPQGAWTDKLDFSTQVVANAVTTFDLNFVPRPSTYPFPLNATLLRGIVTQGSSTGVADAVVRATYDEVSRQDPTQRVPATVEALTDREGEYVLFFKRLPKVNAGDPDLIAKVTAVKGASQSQTVKEVIREGQTGRVNPLDLPG